ncbi:hypothetical protein [Methylobacter sp. YRD-M1]|uniref:hypothetical protein n=1 Tax=Methylobacter sp. YRD-M1 TaxID=2911520 RepID=UPI00227D081E|nr:hypothetical protein [Methylobacter sp. YRD-M1]WAK01882.1 hypothetical protein LZ558_19015 [Methylobacter sp. YRD-M1]
MEKIYRVFSYALNRLKEPSTFAAMASIGALIGLKIDPGLLQDIVTTASVVAGAVGVALGDTK